MIPIPPSRASAIASRDSVTVSIAAETIGISSAIVGVSRVAVATSFGSTADSAGTSSTSSKVRPSLPNFASRSSSNSKSRLTLPTASGGVTGFCRSPVSPVSPFRRSVRRGRQATGCSSSTWTSAARRVASLGSKRPAPTSSTEAEPAATASPSASSAGRPSSSAASQRAEQHVPGAEHRDGLELRGAGAVAPHLPLLPHEREAPRLHRDLDVARPHLGDRVERHQEVVVVLELLADELLGLVLVGRDEPRLGLDPLAAAARPRRRGRRAHRRASSRALRRRRSPRRRRAAASPRRRPSTLRGER